MKKAIRALLCTIGLSLSLPLLSYAGEWKQDDKGWWYENTDGSYLKGGWYWVDGNNYLFDNNGYIYLNTTTPDGYKANESGAWVANVNDIYVNFLEKKSKKCCVK